MEKYVFKQRFSGSIDDSLTDLTGITDNLSKLSRIDQSYRHTLKRLNANYAVAQFIHNHNSELQNYSLKVRISKGIFVAPDYVVPSDYSHKPGSGLERCHISMFPKLILQNVSDASEYELNGQLVVNGRKITIRDFLNLCDIAPTLLNKVDGYLELQGRLHMRDLLEQVRDVTLTPLSNAEKFASHYQIMLTELRQGLTKPVSQKSCASVTTEYKRGLMTTFQQQLAAVRDYITGMEQAIVIFQKALLKGVSSPVLYKVE